MKKRFENILEKPWAAYTFATCAAVVLFLIFSHFNTVRNAFSSVWSILSPVLTGVIIAYLFNPLSNLFERTLCKKLKTDRGKHILAVVLTIVCVVLLLAVFLLALIPSLIKSIALIIKNWNVYTGEISDALNKLSDFFQRHSINIDLSGVGSIVDNSLDKIIEYSKTHYKTILDTVGNVGVGVTHFAFGVIYGFCFLLAKRGIVDCLNKVRSAALTQDVLLKRNQMWSRFHKIFIKFVGSTLLDALIVGVATLIFMLIARMPYAPLIALVVGVTNIIPTVGPWIGSIIGVFFLVLESPIQALIFFIGVTVIQIVDGMLIKTKLFKGTLGIPGSWSFVLLILGGEIAGIAGILLSIPFAAIFMIVYTEYIIPRLEKRKALINAGKAPDTPDTPVAEENEKDNE
ncbi:MAG: AI-2E family transporter [Ruminococcaceae bacterium]|nr:AI-2E family transporter [Oscillospiraceae bacterium]